MNIFIDTSTLFKLYHEEEGTKAIDQYLEKHTIERFYISEITKVEFSSAVCKKLRMSEITVEQAEELISLFEQDYKNYEIVEINRTLINESQILIMKYKEQGLRTLDSIRLASAKSIKDDIQIAMTSDNRLIEIMNLEGIKTE